jgi:hypothetical protein
MVKYEVQKSKGANIWDGGSILEKKPNSNLERADGGVGQMITEKKGQSPVLWAPINQLQHSAQ